MSFLLVPLAAGLLMIAIGVATIVRARRTTARSDEFVRRSVLTQAEVTDLRLKYHRRQSGRGGAFFPVVRFDLPDGRRVDAETLVGAHPAPARPGERVTVRYDRDDPTRVVLASGLAGPGSMGCFRAALGVVSLSMGLLLIAFWFLLDVLLDVPV
jgi:hypothetical protein